MSGRAGGPAGDAGASEREAADARAAVLRASAAGPGEADLAAVAERVGRAVACAEPAGERAFLAERFAAALREGRFLPSVPILSNAGRGAGGQLAACFVLEADDSLGSIYQTLARAARIQQGSGGVGIDLSRLRPRGAPIERSGGVSPGPVAFAGLVAHSARVNSLAGRRAGAHLVVLDDSHPDVADFVEASAAVESLQGAGLALGVHDALLEAARSGAAYELRDPRGAPAGSIRARDLLVRIAVAIRDTGNPTLLFLDAIAAGNPTPQLGAPHATNPCGEQPLLPGESCVLGSLVLPAFADPAGRLDLAGLSEAARLAVRFLDDVHDVTIHPDPQCETASRRTRRIGLGVMGFADLLLLRGEPYGSAASEKTAAEVMAAVRDAARRASAELAAIRGVYPAFRGGAPPRRNASLLAIAPTGTLRLVAGCSGGLEPWLDPVLQVEHSGRSQRWIDRWLLGWLERHAERPSQVVRALEEGVPCAALPGLETHDRALLRRRFEVPAEAQLALQALFQSFVDGGVSKTIHLPPDCPAGRIVELIHEARARGCKGVAFWRDPDLRASPCVRCGSIGPAEVRASGRAR